jgi:putative SOS response-associated peptidase YedK
MCARYVSKATAEWERWFQRRFRVDFASYNIVPTQVAPVVRAGADDGELLRFGLVPFSAAARSPRPRTSTRLWSGCPKPRAGAVRGSVDSAAW